jgi:hypothetical protein
MRALIGEANFNINYSTGGARYSAHVIYETAVNPSMYNESDIVVAITAAMTGAQFLSAYLAAIDAEATRIGLAAAPTEVFGNQIARFR